MNNTLINPAWQAGVASVAAAYAAAAEIGGNHEPASSGDERFAFAAAGIADAIEHLVAIPAPDFAAVNRKLDLLAQEFGGSDAHQLQAISEDLRRLAGIGTGAFDPGFWLRDFEAAGGGFIIRDGGVVFVIPTLGDIGTVSQLIDALDRCPDDRAVIIHCIRQRDRSAIFDEEAGN
jgi:hypothetical protein